MEHLVGDSSSLFQLDSIFSTSNTNAYHGTLSPDIDFDLPWCPEIALEERGDLKPTKIGISSSCIGSQGSRWINDDSIDQLPNLDPSAPMPDLAHHPIAALHQISWKQGAAPSIKAEDESSTSGIPFLQPLSTITESPDNLDADVDTLMKAIQTKSKAPPQHLNSPLEAVSSPRESHGSIPSSGTSVTGDGDASISRKQYQCEISSCGKIFTQKARLNVHSRAHTGHKPYRCKATGCGQTFTQMGNLKTHERRHTGERPFQCGLCNRSFAQSGNMRAHKIVHQRVKPYQCKLENCGKRFTQLGNLKSHQNKFHAIVIRDLTRRFASLRQGNVVSFEDKELWDYFSTLYKHSNKGIKGRGKGRRIPLNEASEDGIKAESDSSVSSA